MSHNKNKNKIKNKTYKKMKKLQSNQFISKNKKSNKEFLLQKKCHKKT